MSHVTPIEVDITCIESAKAMCARMGWQFLEKKTYRWYERYVGDWPLPEGFTANDLGKCDYAIRIPGCSYEIGLVKRGNKYVALFDFYSVGGLERALGGRDAPLLKQMYALERAKRFYKMKGKRTKEIKEKGRIRLCVMR